LVYGTIPEKKGVSRRSIWNLKKSVLFISAIALVMHLGVANAYCSVPFVSAFDNSRKANHFARTIDGRLESDKL
jgi:hypothetical protein